MPKRLQQHSPTSADSKTIAKRNSAAKDMRGNAPRSSTRSFYLISASRDHVLSAHDQSIVQANHGVKAPMQRLRPGDGIAFYSARHKLKGKDLCQRFTAMATVGDGDMYQERMSDTWKPWRRPAVFEEGFKEIDIKEVLSRLECLGHGRQGWGVYLRRGFIKMSASDWEVLVGAKGRQPNVLPFVPSRVDKRSNSLASRDDD